MEASFAAIKHNLSRLPGPCGRDGTAVLAGFVDGVYHVSDDTLRTRLVAFYWAHQRAPMTGVRILLNITKIVITQRCYEYLY